MEAEAAEAAEQGRGEGGPAQASRAVSVTGGGEAELQPPGGASAGAHHVGAGEQPEANGVSAGAADGAAAGGQGAAPEAGGAATAAAAHPPGGGPPATTCSSQQLGAWAHQVLDDLGPNAGGVEGAAAGGGGLMYG